MGSALRHTDSVAGIEQVEDVARLYALVVAGNASSCASAGMAFGLRKLELAESFRCLLFEVVVKFFGAQEHISIRHAQAVEIRS